MKCNAIATATHIERENYDLVSMSHPPSSPSSSSSSSVASQGSDPAAAAGAACGAFHGLVICVTGFSRGYMPLLGGHVDVLFSLREKGFQCCPKKLGSTTLFMDSGQKLQHALKHGIKKGIFVVTLGWFMDSVRANARLSETPYSLLYAIKWGNVKDRLDKLMESAGSNNSSVAFSIRDTVKHAHGQIGLFEKEHKVATGSPFYGCSIYIDPSISAELQSKVVEAATCVGAILMDEWFVDSGASYVVSEQSSVQRYLGHAKNIVTPMWILKASRETSIQRCVCISSDLARDMGMLLRNIQGRNLKQGTHDGNLPERSAGYRERIEAVNHAKHMVRNRRLQQMQLQVQPISPIILLDTICWSVSDPTSTAATYIDSSCAENASEAFLCSKTDENQVEASFANATRPLIESEKKELILRQHFITILFPVDRFAEMGPSARTFFSNEGFTCLNVLDLIYSFYQESMSVEEIEAAVHTDSRHADELRSAYSSESTADAGQSMYRRIDFIGSRRSFEKLKRVSIDNNSNVYELLLRP